MNNNFPKRRIFLNTNEEFFQLFSVTQNKTDHSIYASFPNFENAKWLNVEPKEKPQKIYIFDSLGNGKLSIHGSGMTKVTPNQENLIINGNFLFNKNKQNAGIRHLFTIQLEEPKYKSKSSPMNRKGDHVLKIEKLEPFVMIFFAIPRVRKLSIKIQLSFHINDCNDEIPPLIGLSKIDLDLHSLVWCAYRTNHMDNWPKSPYVCVFDGFFVPIIIGEGGKAFRLELRKPQFDLSVTELKILI